MPEISASAIPLVIGVAGHRDILPGAKEKLENEARGIFTKFRKEYPATPLAVLSALEYGADRLVVEVAISMSIPFYVPLPWPVNNSETPLPYAGGDQDNHKEFRDLLKKAAGTIPMHVNPENGAWELAGAFVVRYCQVLVVLWDGEEDRDRDRQSGTCKMIQWQREGHEVPFSAPLGPLDRPEGGPVFHVVTPRVKNPQTRVGLKKLYRRAVDDEKRERAARKHFQAIWRSFDRYNEWIRGLKPGAIAQSRKRLIPESGPRQLTEPEKFLLECFSRADAAAGRKQSWTTVVMIALFALAGAAFVLVELYAHLGHRPWQLAAYLALLLVAGAVYSLSERKCHQEAYLDYRALAEALRVSVFWSIGGLQDTTADHYLRQFRSELDWIRQAARNCSLLSRMTGESRPPNDAAGLDLIKAHWIKSQRDYFEEREPSKHRMHWLLETAQLALFLFGLAVAAVALMTHLCYGKEDHFLLVIMFGSAVLAAMVTEWSEKMGYAVDARRYQAAYAVFDTAQDKLAGKSAGDPEVAKTLRELGVEALSENADWVIQHRHRPIGTPNM